MSENIYWEGLLHDIGARKCVLLVGPYFAQVENQSIQQYVRSKLRERGGDDISYDYLADGLFLFKSEEAKLNCARRVKTIYRSIELQEELLLKILEIPFPLIISLNPDKFLSEFCYKHSIPHHFSFMRINGEAVENIPEPASDETIIYNLCGCIDDDESLILDYEDLFRLLKTALSESGLPDRVRAIARKAQTFLFLGFQFEKWYSQLLLQLFTGDRKKSSKIAMDTVFANDESHNFVLRQFAVKFMGNGNAFFAELHRQCSDSSTVRLRQINQSALRAGSPDWQNAVQQLVNLLAEADFDATFDQLKILAADGPFSHRALQMLTRYKAWKKDRLNNLLDSRDETRLLNLLISDTAHLLDEMRHE